MEKPKIGDVVYFMRDNCINRSSVLRIDDDGLYVMEHYEKDRFDSPCLFSSLDEILGFLVRHVVHPELS